MATANIKLRTVYVVRFLRFVGKSLAKSHLRWSYGHIGRVQLQMRAYVSRHVEQRLVHSSSYARIVSLAVTVWDAPDPPHRPLVDLMADDLDRSQSIQTIAG